MKNWYKGGTAMISERAMEQTLVKLSRLATMLEERLFTPVGQVETRFYQTTEPLHDIPDAACFGPHPADGRWGGEGMYGWFQGTYEVPEALAGQTLYLYPRTGAYEGMMWVDGAVRGNFAAKFIYGSHGNHYCNLLLADAPAGRRLAIALELYAFHTMPGTQPFTDERQRDFTYPIGSLDVCVRDELYLEYAFDLRTLTALARALPASSFRRAALLAALGGVHAAVLYDPDARGEAFRQALRDTLPLLKAELGKHNGDSAPQVGLVGHSHMDTAWLWPLAETIKKCARTFGNQLTLHEQYPEYRYIQSSACHADMLRRHYPALFARIRQAVAEGWYEPNGGAWVECDCNLTGGEYMVRQFVWGQRFTREHFGYTSDTFWLPDTFGYSYAIPQIMRGCGIRYFLTTKMAWNDTTRFPLTTFQWQGIDGTRVLTHLNRTHLGPDPELLLDITGEGRIGGDAIQEKPASAMRLLSFGKGDGGGGPEFEMLETARRVGDLDGLPRTAYTSVSEFMQALERTVREPTVYAGELYLELHRGTLTNQHTIKRNNRLAETALHNAEFLTVAQAVRTGTVADGEAIAPLMDTLLVNQFHDILPGTCIRRVHDESIEATSDVIHQAEALALAAIDTTAPEAGVTLVNALSFARAETVWLPCPPGLRVAGDYAQQRTEALDGTPCLAVRGVRLPALGAVSLRWAQGECGGASPFRLDGDTLETPFARLRFDENGAIASYVDTATGRELCGPGHPFNTFLLAEDVSAAWDNWDIDADLTCKFRPEAALVSRRVVSDGPVELRLRSVYRLSDASSLTQDMIFLADDPRITFDTRIDWHEAHRFLKVAFDTDLVADGARHEIQFGCIRRTNHRSTDVEKARFEVCNHKYTDLSEAGYGIALLNDCKYGISVDEGQMRLSLHKGGMRPDPMGDCGAHLCRYAFLPHAGDFSAEAVVRPAYAFNHPPLRKPGLCAQDASLVSIDAPNVLIETVKPCEDADRAYILRLYEATGAHTRARLHFGHAVRALARVDMLEENAQPLPPDTDGGASLVLRPFEIQTVRVDY